jgi:hypothetical protein
MNHDITPFRPVPSTALGGLPRGPERLRAALRYATRPTRGALTAPEAMLTGLTALALQGFPGLPRPERLARVEVLVGAQRRLRGTADVTIVRADALPRARSVLGLPCAPLPRAVADAVAGLGDPAAVRSLLVEGLRAADCDPVAVVRELDAAGLLVRRDVAAAVDELLALGRAMAVDRLIAMVREFALPDPFWNVDLWVPDGPYLGSVDAYWPDHSVAVVLGATPVRVRGLPGIEVLRVNPGDLLTRVDRLAEAVRAALAASDEAVPPDRVVVLPR